ncbi:hypothetical protein NMG60_11001962 [Bertholletia excelsa]
MASSPSLLFLILSQTLFSLLAIGAAQSPEFLVGCYNTTVPTQVADPAGTAAATMMGCLSSHISSLVADTSQLAASAPHAAAAQAFSDCAHKLACVKSALGAAHAALAQDDYKGAGKSVHSALDYGAECQSKIDAALKSGAGVVTAKVAAVQHKMKLLGELCEAVINIVEHM